MKINFQRLTRHQDFILETAAIAYENERTDETFNSLMVLVNYMVKETEIWYQRMEFDVEQEAILPEHVDAMIDLSLDIRNESLFKEFSKFKSYLSA